MFHCLCAGGHCQRPSNPLLVSSSPATSCLSKTQLFSTCSVATASKMGETNGTNGAAAPEAAAAAEAKKPFSRLPTTVKPVHYVVKVKPDLSKFTFTGSVEIQLDVNQATGKEK